MEKYKKIIQNNEFKMSAPIWNEQYELPDRSYPANIRLDEDVIKTNKPYYFKTSWRRPGQDQYIRLGHMS